MKYAFLDKYGILGIHPSKSVAQSASANGKIVETDFPEVQGYPLKSGSCVIKKGMPDWSNCEFYKVKSLKEAEACGNATIAELYKAVM